MKIGKFHVISDKEFQSMREDQLSMINASEMRRWFSGWQDLDIIWKHILDWPKTQIWTVREEYANARGTDVYGNPLKGSADA